MREKDIEVQWSRGREEDMALGNTGERSCLDFVPDCMVDRQMCRFTKFMNPCDPATDVMLRRNVIPTIFCEVRRMR